MIGGFFKAIYHWMALLGLAMKDDEPIEVRDPDRQWGPQIDGLMLSAKAKAVLSRPAQSSRSVSPEMTICLPASMLVMGRSPN